MVKPMSTSNIVLLVIFALWAYLTAMKHVGKAPVDKVKELVRDGAALIDVRTKEEFTRGHISGAKNIPLGELDSRVGELGNKDGPVVVYCRSGARSRAARSTLEKAGFSRVVDLGAMRRWK